MPAIVATLKQAALDKDVKLMNLPCSDFKQGIDLYIGKLWQLAWGVQVDNKLYSLRPCVGTNIPLCLSGRDEVVIKRLHIGHTFLTHCFFTEHQNLHQSVYHVSVH